MKLLGNLSLCVALLLLIYPLIPNLPGLRSAIMRSNNGPLGAIYVLTFVLTPQWVRLMLASMALWNLLTFAMATAVGRGALDWICAGRPPQYLLIIVAGLAMAQISILIGLTYNDPGYEIPSLVRAISPWAGYALPLAVMAFALMTLNPALTRLVSPWMYRIPLLAAFAISLPIFSVLFVRWITPISSAS